MKIVTETGSTYVVDDLKHCVKYDKVGNMVDQFFVTDMKAVPNTVSNWKQVFESPKTKIVVGKRMFIGGRDSWWISTKVVSVE